MPPVPTLLLDLAVSFVEAKGLQLILGYLSLVWVFVLVPLYMPTVALTAEPEVFVVVAEPGVVVVPIGGLACFAAAVPIPPVVAAHPLFLPYTLWSNVPSFDNNNIVVHSCF